MSIDAETLEEAIKLADETWHFGSAEGVERFKIIMAAARAHLATLPRYKEVEVEAFAVVGCDGTMDACWQFREHAEVRAKDMGRHVVRLTGVANVKVTP